MDVNKMITMYKGARDSGRSTRKFHCAGLRVLIVDDDVTCRFVYAMKLATSQCKVKAAKNGNEALEALRDTRGGFDLVLTDVHMPGMNGFQLMHHIQKEFDIPIILMSGNEGVAKRGLQLGACCFLAKPITLKLIQEELWQHVIKRKRGKMMNNTQLIMVQISNPPIEGNVEDGTLHQIVEDKSGSGSSSSLNTASNFRVQKNKCRGPKGMLHNVQSKQKFKPKSSQKKPRVVWDYNLHNKFLDAIATIGTDKVVPKKIHELMKVPNIRRENVASHLQKYRIFLKRAKEINKKNKQNALRGESTSAPVVVASNNLLTITDPQQPTTQFPESSQLLGLGGISHGVDSQIPPQTHSDTFANFDASSGYMTEPLQFGELVPQESMLQPPLLSITTYGNDALVPSLSHQFVDNLNPNYAYPTGIFDMESSSCQGVRTSPLPPSHNLYNVNGVLQDSRSGMGLMEQMVHGEENMGVRNDFGVVAAAGREVSSFSNLPGGYSMFTTPGFLTENAVVFGEHQNSTISPLPEGTPVNQHGVNPFEGLNSNPLLSKLEQFGETIVRKMKRVGEKRDFEEQFLDQAFNLGVHNVAPPDDNIQLGAPNHVHQRVVGRWVDQEAYTVSDDIGLWRN